MPVRDFTINTGLEVSGSTRVSGSVSASGGFTGSLQGTASYGQEANLLDGRDSTEFALTSSTNYFKADQIVSGSLTVTASLTASNITASTGKYNYLDFVAQTATPDHSAGRLYYDTATRDLTFNTDVSDLSLFVGQQLIARVYNNTGGTLSKGTVVKINGEQGDRPTIVTASWENDSNSANTLGIVMRDIAYQADGYVLLSGLLTNVNTSQYNVAAGSQLYLSSSGLITGGVPPTPYHEVRLGELVKVSPGNGSIFVRIQNGYELEELHNLDVISVQNGDLLRYRSSDGQWINSKFLTGSYQLTGGLDVLGNVSASTITGSFSGSYLGTINGVSAVAAGTNLTSSLVAGYQVLSLTSSITGGLANISGLTGTTSLTGSFTILSGTNISGTNLTINSLTVPGNLVVSGNTTLGDAITDRVTINSSNTLISGALTITGALATTGALNINNNTLYISANNRVGIGNFNPQTFLDITTDNPIGTSLRVKGGSSSPDIRISSSFLGSYGQIGTYSSHDFVIVTNSIERLRVSSANTYVTGTLNVSGSVSASAGLTSSFGLYNILSGTTVTGTNALFTNITGANINNTSITGSTLTYTTLNTTRLTSSGPILVDNVIRIGIGKGTNNTNLGIGVNALLNNSNFSRYNVAIGYNAMSSSAAGLSSDFASANTAIGQSAMLAAVSGSKNVSIGSDSFFGMTSGSNNIAIGNGAGSSITTAEKCVFIGSYDGRNHRNLTGSIVISDGTEGVGNIRLEIDGNGLVKIPGSLTVSGNLTLGDATTDSITLNAATMSLGNGTGLLNIDSNTLYVDGNLNKVGFGTNSVATSALVEMSGTNLGLLFPRVSGSARATMTGATGLIVYQTDTSGSDAEGLYIYKSSGWIQII